MLEHIEKERILFLDIETVPQTKSYDELPGRMKDLWAAKAENLARNERNVDEAGGSSPDLLYKRAGIYAEFGKIVCISVGHFHQDVFRLKSFYGDDELNLMQDFAALLEKSFSRSEHLLCAHNGKEFDFPYISRRMLIHGMKVPRILDLAGKKPWEVQHLDTMELWKFGDFKNYTSLVLLAAIFNIPSPKDDIDGSEVGRVYWEEHDLERIAVYCRKDVVTIARLFQKFRGEEMLSDEDIVLV